MFFIRMLITILILLCIIGAIGGWFARVPIVESVLSKKLNAEVTIEDVSIAWGKITLKNLRLKNPSSHIPHAFEASALTVQFAPAEFFKERIHIQRIKIQDPHLAIELYNNSGNENNWSTLLSRAPSSSTSTPSHTFIVDRLSLVNVQIDIIRSNGKTFSLPPVPYLEFQGIGNHDSLDVSGLIRQLFIKILESIPSKQNLNTLLDKLSEASSDSTNNDQGSSFDSVKSTVKEGVEVIKRKTEEVTEYLQNLFSK